MAVLLAVLSMLVIAQISRSMWFFADVWDHLTNRRLTSLDDLLRPRGAHWATPAVVVTRVAYGLAGMDFWPVHYLLRLVGWAAVSLYLWRVLLRRGADRRVAMAVLVILLFFGPSNWLTSYYMGSAIVVATLVASASLIESHDRPGPRQRWALFGLTLLGVMSSGEGVAAMLAMGFVILVSGRLRQWYAPLVGTAGVYAAWYLTYNTRGAVERPPIGVDILLRLPETFVEVVRNALPRLVAVGPELGGALTLGLAAWLVWLAMRSKLGVFDAIMLLTATVYLSLVVVGRILPGLGQADAIRYADTLGLMIIPVLIPHVHPPPGRPAAIVIMGLVAAMLLGHVRVLQGGINFWEARSSASRQVVEAAASLVAAGEPYLPNGGVDSPRSGVLTFAGLQQLLDEGWAPAAPDDPDVIEEARARARTALASGDRPHGVPAEADVPLDDEGCTRLAAGQSLDVVVVEDGALGLYGSARTELALMWVDEFGEGELETQLGGASKRLWLGDPMTSAQLTLAVTGGPPLRVCGLVAPAS